MSYPLGNGGVGAQASWGSGFARNAAEAMYTQLWPGLIEALFPLLGATGLVVHDISSPPYNSDLTNMDPATDWIVVDQGWALDFDGGDDALHLSGLGVGAANKLNGLTALTFACLVKFDTLAADADLLVEGAHNGDAKVLFWMDNASPDHLAWLINGSGASTSAFTPATGTWYHIVFTFEGSTAVRIFINGVEDANSPWESSIPADIGTVPGGESFWMFNDASLGSGSKGFNGQAIYGAIWDRAISASEIKLLASRPDALIARPNDLAMQIAAMRGFVAPAGGSVVLRRRRECA